MNVAILVSVLALAAWAVAGVWEPASAQTEDEPRELFRGRSGVYEIIVGIRPNEPLVGTIHFLVSALDAATRENVADARVLIVAINEDGVPTYQSLAVNTIRSPDLYEANITFSKPGKWDLRVDVESGLLGAASFDVPLEVRPLAASASRSGTILFGGVLVVLVGGTIYLSYAARRSRRRAQPG
jgi:hypothetical protein